VTERCEREAEVFASLNWSFSIRSPGAAFGHGQARHRAGAGEALLRLGDATLLDGLSAGETMQIGGIVEFDPWTLAD